MYRGVTSRYQSRTTDFLKKYDMVMSGHYHHKSDNGQVYYLGSPYEINWADFNDPRGFHLFDTETLDLTFIQNCDRLHHKIFYDDSKEIDMLDMSEYEGRIVKLVVIEKTNYKQYDRLIDELDTISSELMIIEDFTLDDDDDDIITTEDTLTALSKYVDSTELDKVDNEVVKKILQELYIEAINIT
jgi:DNA repair exonuclease SbcCD nuclease subunit